MKLQHCLALLLLAGSAVGSASAQSLFGSQVTLTFESPLGVPYTIPNTQIVGAGVEYPNGSIVGVLPAIRDVGADFIDLTFLNVNPASVLSGTFNGAIYSFDAASPTILGATLSINDVVAGTPVVSFSAHQVRIDTSGLTFVSGSHVRVDLNVGTVMAPVPEPSTYALMFGGLGLGALVARRRNKATK